MVEKMRKLSFFKSVRNYFREYCNSTSIHGFKYFGEKRSYVERGWWFIVFVITLTACFFSIRVVFMKWIKSPVIVTFATTETPVYSIPFPAVTICSESKSAQFRYSHQDLVTAYVNKESANEEHMKLLKYMGLLCNKQGEIEYPKDEFVGDEIYKIFKEVQVSNFLATRCKFMGKTFLSEEVFERTMTDEGICYTFNAVHASQIFKDNVVNKTFNRAKDINLTSQWTIEDGYLDETDVDAYPRRALLSGVNNALIVNLNSIKLDVDQACKDGDQGYKVTLHLPTRIPRISLEYFRVPENEKVMAAVIPNMIKTSSSLKDYSVKKRHCYFSDERHLKYFKVYTPKNCKLECLTNFTLYHCGCVGFFMPRENSTRICGIGSVKCMEYAENRYLVYNMHHFKKFSLENTSLENKTWPNEGKYFAGLLPKCGCLPTCSDLTYNVESSQCKWRWYDRMHIHYRNGSVPFSEDLLRMSQLIVYFKNSEFIYSERNELYGPLDFLANLGGLLGLFTGFSLLSVMEIFYFLTLRIFFNIRMYGNWSGQEEKIKQ